MANSREHAKNIRIALKNIYRDTKFSVRCGTGTAYNYIDVTWQDGPTEESVKAAIGHMHNEISLDREYSETAILNAAEILAAACPKVDVFNGGEPEYANIDWDANFWDAAPIIGSVLIRIGTMTSVLNEIALHYVLGEAEPYDPIPCEEETVDLDALDSDDQNLVEHTLGLDDRRGRLTAAHPFVLKMHPGEKPHLDVKTVRPFEAVLRAVPDPVEPSVEVDLTPREIASLSPLGRPLSIFSVPALVLADGDGYTAGELVWVGRTISTVLDQTERVLVSRGDGHPLTPLTTSFLALV